MKRLLEEEIETNKRTKIFNFHLIFITEEIIKNIFDFLHPNKILIFSSCNKSLRNIYKKSYISNSIYEKCGDIKNLNQLYWSCFIKNKISLNDKIYHNLMKKYCLNKINNKFKSLFENVIFSLNYNPYSYIHFYMKYDENLKDLQITCINTPNFEESMMGYEMVLIVHFSGCHSPKPQNIFLKSYFDTNKIFISFHEQNIISMTNRYKDFNKWEIFLFFVQILKCLLKFHYDNDILDKINFDCENKIDHQYKKVHLFNTNGYDNIKIDY